jgi:hypothetical protein
MVGLETAESPKIASKKSQALGSQSRDALLLDRSSQQTEAKIKEDASDRGSYSNDLTSKEEDTAGDEASLVPDGKVPEDELQS